MKDKDYELLMNNAKFCRDKGFKRNAIYFYKQAREVANSEEKRQYIDKIIEGLKTK